MTARIKIFDELAVNFNVTNLLFNFSFVAATPLAARFSANKLGPGGKKLPNAFFVTNTNLFVKKSDQ